MLKQLFFIASLFLAVSPLLAQQSAQPNAVVPQTPQPVVIKYPTVQDLYTGKGVKINPGNRVPLSPTAPAQLPGAFMPQGGNLTLSNYDRVLWTRMQDDVIPNLMAPGSPFLAFWNETLKAFGKQTVSSANFAAFFRTKKYPNGMPIYTCVFDKGATSKATTASYYDNKKNSVKIDFIRRRIIRILDTYEYDNMYSPDGPHAISLCLNPFIWYNNGWVFSNEKTTEKEIKASLTHELSHAFLLTHCPALRYFPTKEDDVEATVYLEDEAEKIYLKKKDAKMQHVDIVHKIEYMMYEELDSLIGRGEEITYLDVVNKVCYAAHEAYASYTSYMYYQTAFCNKSMSYAQLQDRNLIKKYVEDYLNTNPHKINAGYMLTLLAYLQETKDDKIIFNLNKLQRVASMVTLYKETLYNETDKNIKEKVINRSIHEMINLTGEELLLHAQNQEDMGDIALGRYLASLGYARTLLAEIDGLSNSQKSQEMKDYLKKTSYRRMIRRFMDHITADKMSKEVYYDEIISRPSASSAQGTK